MRDECKDCVFLVNLNCHPCNGEIKLNGFLEDPLKIGKGQINQSFAFSCLLPLNMNISDGKKSVTYFDNDNGICEMFTDNKKFKIDLKVRALKK